MLPDIKDISELNKNINKPKGQKIGALKKKDGTYSEPGEDTIKELINTHFPKSHPLTATKHSNMVMNTKKIADTNIDWINMQLIREAMLGLKKKKSPGPDGLRPIVFTYLPNNIIKEI